MRTALDIDRIKELRPQNLIHYFETVGSTMTEGARLAELGAPHGTAILADEQTAGQGRLGRHWRSDKGAGIYCTVLVRLRVPAAKLPVTSLVLGLSTSEAIEKTTSVSCDLRWPNDVLIGSRKVSGVLTHFSDGCIIAGVGINVNQTEFDSNPRTPATSLRIETGKAHDREPIIAALLAAIDIFCSVLETQGSRAILCAFARRSTYVLDRRVVVEENGHRGITSGLDENGFLRLRLDNGHLETLQTGGIRPDV